MLPLASRRVVAFSRTVRRLRSLESMGTSKCVICLFVRFSCF